MSLLRPPPRALEILRRKATLTLQWSTRSAAVALVVAGAFAPGPAVAQSPQDVANDVAAEIMSPYCPGVTLHDCPSAEATELRERIVGWARDGATEGQIIARLEEEFGPSIRSTPPAEGAGVVAWLLPAAAVLLGAGLAAAVAQRWIRNRQSPAVSAPSEPPTEDERERLEAELAELRRSP